MSTESSANTGINKSSFISIGLTIALLIVVFWGGMELGQVKERQEQNLIEHARFVTKNEFTGKIDVMITKLEGIQSRLDDIENE